MRRFVTGLIAMMGILSLQAQEQDITADADGIMRVGIPIKVACIADGCGDTPRDWAWPAQLNKLLGPEYQVTNCSASGTGMGRKDSTSCWNTECCSKVKAANPDILLIAHGTNDADSILFRTLASPVFSERKERQDTHTEEKMIPEVKEIAAEVGARIIGFHAPSSGRNECSTGNGNPNDEEVAIMAELAKNAIAGQQKLISHIKVKKGTVINPTTVVAEPNSSVTLMPESPVKGSWHWNGPKGFSSKKRVLNLKKLTAGGVYTVHFQDGEGNRSLLRFLICLRGQKAGSIMPHVAVTGNSWQQGPTLSVRPGQSVNFSPSCSAGNDAGTWSWRGPNGFFAYSRQLTIDTMTEKKAGRYGVTYTDAQGRQASAIYTIKVEGEPVTTSPHPMGRK